MSHLYLLPITAIYSGIWWRFRGGAFTALTGFDPGTGGMRAIAAVAMGAPLMCFGWWLALMIPALWCGWSLAGWGAFQGMGYAGEVLEVKNPVARLLGHDPVLLADLTLLDFIGMAIEGVYCLLLPSAAMAYATGHAAVAMVCFVGVLFAPAYWLAQKRKRWWPHLGKFAQPGSEWAEVLVGCIVGTAISLGLFWTSNL